MSIPRRNTLAAGFALAAALYAPELPAQYLGWHGDLDKAAARARETGKPLFVVFRCER